MNLQILTWILIFFIGVIVGRILMAVQAAAIKKEASIHKKVIDTKKRDEIVNKWFEQQYEDNEINDK